MTSNCWQRRHGALPEHRDRCARQASQARAPRLRVAGTLLGPEVGVVEYEHWNPNRVHASQQCGPPWQRTFLCLHWEHATIVEEICNQVYIWCSMGTGLYCKLAHSQKREYSLHTANSQNKVLLTDNSIVSLSQTLQTLLLVVSSLLRKPAAQVQRLVCNNESCPL